MNILSIDASTKSSGWAWFEDTSLKTYGCITASSADLINRIYKMRDELRNILSTYKVDKIILEEVLPEQGLQNIKTHKALLYLQAEIVKLVHDEFNQIQIEFVYPNQWRKACGIKTGKTRRSSLKPLDVAFVKDTYNIEVNDDIADAIGIGHAYIFIIDNEINWE